MKNHISQFLLVIVAFAAFTFLMSYTRPAADEAKQFIVVFTACNSDKPGDFEQEVNKKISEGWHPQGGISFNGRGYVTAMVK